MGLIANFLWPPSPSRSTRSSRRTTAKAATGAQTSGSRTVSLAVRLWFPMDKGSLPTDSGHAVRVLLDPSDRLPWPGTVVEDNNLNVQISTLRRVLDQDRSQGSCIQTVPGRGYRFVAPVTRVEADPRAAIRKLPGDSEHLRPRLSIVVLPFVNLSDHREQQYFADGITEDLTTSAQSDTRSPQDACHGPLRDHVSLPACLPRVRPNLSVLLFRSMSAR
jgi:hypothetical protein